MECSKGATGKIKTDSTGASIVVTVDGGSNAFTATDDLNIIPKTLGYIIISVLLVGYIVIVIFVNNNFHKRYNYFLEELLLSRYYIFSLIWS